MDSNKSKQLNPQKYTLNLGDQMKELVEVLDKYKAIADNPLTFSQIFLGLKAAMDNFNNLLLDLNRRLTDIDERLTSLESGRPHEGIMLSKRDEEILSYVKSHGRVTAEDIQKAFDYRGRHAASARLSRLYTLGMLEKAHAGRTVYYLAPKPNP